MTNAEKWNDFRRRRDIVISEYVGARKKFLRGNSLYKKVKNSGIIRR